jgi:hypothetical protein
MAQSARDKWNALHSQMFEDLQFACAGFLPRGNEHSVAPALLRPKPDFRFFTGVRLKRIR